MSRLLNSVKIDYDSLKLCGREDELELLRDAFERATGEATISPTTTTKICIEGPSGSGKTALVDTFLERVSKKYARILEDDDDDNHQHHHCRVVIGRGNYDEQRASILPISPFTDALNDVVEQLFQWDRQGIDCGNWQQTFKQNFGTGHEVLQHVIPALQQLVGDEDQLLLQKPMNSCPACIDSRKKINDDHPETSVQHHHCGEHEETVASIFQRMLVELRSLLRSICCQDQGKPRILVILVLDDIQWETTDVSTLKAVQYLILDNEVNSNLFFISICRSDKPNAMFERLLDMSRRKDKDFLSIKVSSLTMTAIAQILSTLLKRSHEEVKPLAVLIHHKTRGNSYFALEFIRYLEMKRLICYSITNFRWEWDSDRILAETDLSDNVAEVVSDKISSLPETHQKVLMNAACLSTTRFNVNTLFGSLIPADLFERGESKDNDLMARAGDSESFVVETVEELEQLLAEVSQHDVVEKIGEGEYKFSHDRLREVAYMLIPELCRKTIHLEVGRKVRRMVKALPDEVKGTEAEQRLVLIAINQLNLGSDLLHDQTELIDLAKLNYQAAHHARKNAVFHPAVDFLETARGYLGPNAWWEHYDFMMSLSIDLARMYYAVGRQTDSFRLSSDLVKLARTPKDRRRASRTRVKCLVQQGKPKDALDIVLSELLALGVYFPSNFRNIHIRVMKNRARQLLKGKSDTELLNVGMEVEEHNYSVAIFLSQLLDLLQRLAQPRGAKLAELVLVVITLENQIGPRMAWAFNVWGALLANKRKFSEAYRFGRLALELSEREGHCNQDFSTIIFVHAYTQCWVRPYQESLDPLLRASESIIRVGRVDEIKNSFFYILIYFCSGLQLQPLEHETRRLIETLVNHGLDASRNTIAPLHQMLLNLIAEPDGNGECLKDPTELDGEALTKEEIEGWKSTGEAITAQGRVCLTRLILAYLFLDFTTAVEMAHGFPSYVISSSAWEAERTFFQGMTYLSLAITNPRKYRRKSKRFVSLIESWVRNGALNCHHMWLIMKAEQAAGMRGEAPKNVQSKFDEAIVAAGKLGFLHHQALANERAGTFFHRGGDDRWAKTYFQRARELYFRWGAFAKVGQMERKYCEFFKDCSMLKRSGTGGGVLRATSRLFQDQETA